MNNEFEIVIRDRKAVISSRDVARIFEKPHNDLLKAIRNLKCSEELDQVVALF